MQLSLVSHYGHKPEKLAWHLKNIQHELANLLPKAFTPYALEQIHATIIGLEGYRRNGRIENLNFHNSGQSDRYIDTSQLVQFLRSPAVPSFEVQIGGYVESLNYHFLSQGKRPFYRSFSIQDSIAVAMGWPADRSRIIDDFRRSFNQINVLHKWHQTDMDIDNDFFLVLGRVNREFLTHADIVNSEQSMRHFMASLDPLVVDVNRSTLSLVCYQDTRLPLNSSRIYAIDDANLTSDDLLQCYEK